MFYRENGQFKASYVEDQRIFKVVQDRVAIMAIVAIAALLVPMLASDYLLRGVLIPFLVLSLAAIGLNILVGYCGQISLGTGAFMAVGAYAAWMGPDFTWMEVGGGMSITGLVAVLMLFVLARVFAVGAAMRDDLDGVI